MTPQQWEIIERLFHNATQIPASQRTQFLDESEVSDPAVRRKIEMLLYEHDHPGTFLTHTAVEANSAPLAAGSRIGPYETLEPIGAGAMGCVYRARDPRLSRNVAIKALPAEFAFDPERLVRFEREATILGALNHPNIAAIHDVAEQDNVRYLVLEYVEGETLAERLLQGPLPLDEVLRLAYQIAFGLEAAHEKNIVHRDLKPTNIMITQRGQVKLLDFGIAKGRHDDPPLRSFSESQFDIVGGEDPASTGTPAYMSPEQVLGKPVDFRSDIFVCGIIFYQMVAGIRPFDGNQRETLRATVEASAAPLIHLRDECPALERVIQRCLQKNPEDRYADTRILSSELQELSRSLSTYSSGTKRRPFARLAIKLATVFFLIVLAILTIPRLTRAPLPPSHKQLTFLGDARSPALSPDAGFLAYLTPDNSGGRERLVVENVRTGERQLTKQFDGAVTAPVWSHDGSKILLQTYPLATGNPPFGNVIVSPSGQILQQGYLGFIGQSWSPDDSRLAGVIPGHKAIYIRRLDQKTQDGLVTIPVDGPFTLMVNAEWSPAGDRLLFLTSDANGKRAIWTIRTDGRQQEHVIDFDGPSTLAGSATGSAPPYSARWANDGDSIYCFSGGSLLKVQVSRNSGKPKGIPRVLLAGLQAGNTFSVSRDGKRLAYTRLQQEANLWTASMRPRKGRTGESLAEVQQLTTGTGINDYPNISPNGLDVAFSRGDAGKTNIFVMPISGGASRQLTFLDSRATHPAWSPDGNTIAFAAMDSGRNRVWRVSAKGGSAQPFKGTLPEGAMAWAPGDRIFYPGLVDRTARVLDVRTGVEKPMMSASDDCSSAVRLASSPDGSKIGVWCYRAVPPGGCCFGLWIASVTKDSAEMPLRYTPGDYFPIRWSRDGRFIYAWRGNFAMDGREIVMIDANDQSVVVPILKIPVPANITVGWGWMDISPDGEKIVYSVRRNQSDVWLTEKFDPDMK